MYPPLALVTMAVTPLFFLAKHDSTTIHLLLSPLSFPTAILLSVPSTVAVAPTCHSQWF